MRPFDFNAGETSERQTVVLLHSSASSSRQWSALVELLGPRFDVRAVDLHGHGAQPALARRAVAVARRRSDARRADPAREGQCSSRRPFVRRGCCTEGRGDASAVGAQPRRLRACPVSAGCSQTTPLRTRRGKSSKCQMRCGASSRRVRTTPRPQCSSITGLAPERGNNCRHHGRTRSLRACGRCSRTSERCTARSLHAPGAAQSGNTAALPDGQRDRRIHASHRSHRAPRPAARAARTDR